MLITPTLVRDPSLADAPVRLALVWGGGLREAKARDVAGPWLTSLLARVAASEEWLSPARKAAVRDLLRHGSYKPAGRAKPSSEYLVAAALEGDFPIVNAPVDANNAVSLEYGYPASVFDLGKCGSELLVKRGGEGDSYVFNQSGQAIDLADLLCVWRRIDDHSWEPTGNPVKDAMATKVFEGCTEVAAVVYAPEGPEGSDLEACAERLVTLLREECGAVEAAWMPA